MKTLIESIFDDDQTYVNKSGELDPVDILKADKTHKQLQKWLKANDLMLSKSETQKFILSSGEQSVIYGNTKNYTYAEFVIKNDINSQWGDDKLICFYLAESNHKFIKIYKHYPEKKYQKIAKMLKDVGYQKDPFYSTFIVFEKD